MEMRMLQMLLHVSMIQAGLFILCMDGVNSTYQTQNLTLPCKLNYPCDLPCRLHPYTSVTVMWFNGHNEMLSQGLEIRKNHKILKIEKPAPDEWTLRILRVNRKHEGTYQCKTNNNDTLSVITVVIEHKPKIDEKNSSLLQEYVREMSDAQLICIFSAIPEPEITWHRGQSEEIIDGIKGHKLIIRDVKRYASDEYTCVATNKHGSSKIHIRLIVTFAPEVTVIEQEVYAASGEEVTMGCMVQASPLSDAFWIYHEDVMIVNSTWKYEVKVEEESELFPVRFLELRIKANVLSVHDQGNYTCHGFGENQETSAAVVVLKVKD